MAEDPEEFVQDEDGNLTKDGRWLYTSEADEARADLESGLPRWKYQFTYDYMGRRVQKTSHSWDDVVWNNDADERLVYDGWNLIRASGEAAYVNPFRFSTKYHDEETGLYYYGYRYLQPINWAVVEPGSD